MSRTLRELYICSGYEILNFSEHTSLQDPFLKASGLLVFISQRNISLGPCSPSKTLIHFLSLPISLSLSLRQTSSHRILILFASSSNQVWRKSMSPKSPYMTACESYHHQPHHHHSFYMLPYITACTLLHFICTKKP